MGILTEIFRAVFIVGIPVAVFTLAMVWWSLQRGYLKESVNTRALQREMEAMSKKNNKKKEPGDDGDMPGHPLQKKWMKFGGGFYGIVAFFTYIVVEMIDLGAMVINYGGFFEFLGQLGVHVIIEMFIDALTNFITAMTWPWYWMGRIDTNHVWVWFLVAYAGYWAGLKTAQLLVRKSSQAKL